MEYKYNYILLSEGFHRWLETDYLPGLAQLLFLKIIHLFNIAGWSEWVQVDNQRMMCLAQMKWEKSFIELRDKLIEKGLIILYEAAIAGGIPIIMPLKMTLCGNKISKIQGILNGTTN